ncbi:MAG: ATP-binding protein [Candidatus Sericytochromatia bacterium]
MTKATLQAPTPLKRFAAYLREHHLPALSAENLRLARELNTPLLRIFAHVSEAELIQQGIEGMRLFLTDLEEDRALERANESLRQWEHDELPGLPKDQVEASDLVLVYAAQKRSIISFLPRYTDDVAQATAIMLALEAYYTEVQDAAVNMYARMRQESEAALRQSRERLAEAQHLVRLGSWEFEVETRKVHWSDEMFRIFGHEPGDFEPTLEHFFAGIHPEDRPRVAEAMEQQSAQNRSGSLDYRIVLPTGEVRMVHGRGDVLADEAGKPVKVIGTLQDVTALKRAEGDLRARTSELERANAQLLEADKHKDEFISIISHELRTPLNFIMGFASILDDELHGPLTERQHEDVGKILDGTDRMLDLVNDLLDIAKIQAGKLSVFCEEMPFSPLASAVLGDLKPIANRRKVALRLEEGPPETLPMDGALVSRVLTNLVDNAIKFSPEGAEVRVRYRPEGACLRVEVQDRGPGITPEGIATLFKRFQQIDMSSTRTAGGTGLGLAISKGLVEAMGGDIGVESRVGEGSTFWFTLPRG